MKRLRALGRGLKLEHWLQNSTARVLSCMARRPRRTWQVVEVAEHAGVALGTASERLRELERLGLVARPFGANGPYVLRRDHPLVRQWKLLLTTWDLLPVVRKLRPLASRIVLFGSAAEGRDDEESDVDLYIEADDPSRVDQLLPDRLNGRPLQALVCDPTRAAQIMTDNPALWENISRGVVLWDEVEAW